MELYQLAKNGMKNGCKPGERNAGKKMLEIQDSFLEPEVRDGFYIPSIVKQAWAAELKVLGEIDRICKKYDIPYFADWGTLLGAVRHGGFIPWDDDLDITMKRADYERFLQVAERELPEGYAVFTYEKHPDFWSFLARVVAKNRICFEEEHLREFYGFPYIVGVDLFVLDYVSTDETKEKDRVTLARYVKEVADEIAGGRLAGEKASQALRKIEQTLGVKLHDKTDVHSLRVQMYHIVERLFSMFSEAESKELTRMMPDGLYGNGHLRLKKEYYDKQIWLPFENTVIPVPGGYDEMLRKRYGDYMKLVRNCGGHDYPFFETQKKQLQAVLDFEMPGYKYTGIALRDAVHDRENSLKVIAAQACEKLCEYAKAYENSMDGDNGAPDMELLGEGQQLAIELGTLIENCKGEGHPVIAVLETYCEAVYELSCHGTRESVDSLWEVLENLRECIRKDILERKTVVFLPYKASDWRYMKGVWQAAAVDESCDVYVIPIPYFYKEYDGELRDMQYEAEQFPADVQVVAYDEFDFALHYPEVIFTQNPYDAYDPVVSVHTFFYSENLKHYTEKLVYLPPFVLEEFTKENYREYFNMKYYCTMPGVVNADCVIAQSENMRCLYVEKLTEFAGADTRTVWEEKILGNGLPKAEVPSASWTEERNIPEKWRAFAEKSDGSCKKVMLYYIGLSSFIQYREQMLTKMRETFHVFAGNREETAVIWKLDLRMKSTLEQAEPELYRQYCLLEQEFLERKLGILSEGETDELLVSSCDAYYGDASPLAQMCRSAGKPVMLQKCIEL